MTKKPKDNSVGPWAKEKLSALNDYLSAYTQVLKNQSWCQGTVYFDAFAGPGLSPVRATPTPIQRSSNKTDLFGASEPEIDKEAVEFIKGSPRVALDIPNAFSRYVFNETDGKRLRDLELLRNEYGSSRNIEIKQKDANSELLALVAGQQNWRAHRGVVFIDPFGMQISWSTIQVIAKTGSLEVIINFPWAMAIWPAPGSEDTELGVLMGPEVRHGEAEVYARVQA